MSAITAAAARGYDSGDWKGMTGISSSLAAVAPSHMAVDGVILNKQGGLPLYGTSAPLGKFDGQDAARSDVFIKFTTAGDANLDGRVDGSDYSLVDAGFAGHLTGWANGDFNYDGLIDPADPAKSAHYHTAAGAVLALLSSPAYLGDSSKPGDGVIVLGALNVPATPTIADNSVVYGDYYNLEAPNHYLVG